MNQIKCTFLARSVENNWNLKKRSKVTKNFLANVITPANNLRKSFKNITRKSNDFMNEGFAEDNEMDHNEDSVSLLSLEAHNSL